MSDQEILDGIDNDNRWDIGELGRDEKYVKSVETTPEKQKALDESLGLEMVNIRLPVNVIEEYKKLAEKTKRSYISLMRQVLLDNLENS